MNQLLTHFGLKIAAVISVIAITSMSAHAQNQAASFDGSFTLEGTSDEYITQGQKYSFSEQTGKFQVEVGADLQWISIRYEDKLIKGESFPRHYFSVDFKAVKGHPLLPGKYLDAKRAAFTDETVYGEDGTPQSVTERSGLDLSGNGRGCNQLTGDFEIKTLAIDHNGVLQNFAATFVQRCESGASYATGSVSLKRGHQPQVKIQLN